MLKQQQKISLRVFGGLLLLLFVSCVERSHDEKVETKTDILPEKNIQYHFMIENSGSMKGYFYGKSKAKEIITNLYDRLDEQLNVERGDTITLNYINTEITPFDAPIEQYLQQTWSKCTESYTKLDDILSMAFTKANSEDVTLLISDYCFTSDLENLEMAKSGITNLFVKGLRGNKELSIAILKFNSDFNGKYYPGGLPCKQSRPFYVWVLGNTHGVKKVIELPNIMKEGVFILQPSVKIVPEILAKSARMKGDSKGLIVVSYWKKDRHSNSYSVKIKFDASNLIIREQDIINIENYELSSGYSISNIDIHENICEMTVTTAHPSPGDLVIGYQNALPLWIDNSDFEGTGIPPEGKTVGIKMLIEGVYNAYANRNKNIFTVNIKLE